MEKWNYFFAGLIGATIIYVIIIFSIIFVDVIKKEKEQAILIKEIGPFSCDVFTDVRNTFDSNIIINDGKLYNISLDLKFSNEQNCKEISDVNITKVVNNHYISNENKTYSIDETGLKEYNASGKIPAYMYNEDVVMAYTHGSNSEYKYYVLKTDGKIYDVNFGREFRFENGVGTYIYNVIEEKVYKEIENEVIKSFDVIENNVDYVVTDKGLYINKVSNSECMSYADIDCVYELSKNDIMTTPMDEVSYINHFENTIKYVTNNVTYYFGV